LPAPLLRHAYNERAMLFTLMLFRLFFRCHAYAADADRLYCFARLLPLIDAADLPLPLLIFFSP